MENNLDPVALTLLLMLIIAGFLILFLRKYIVIPRSALEDKEKNNRHTIRSQKIKLLIISILSTETICERLYLYRRINRELDLSRGLDPFLYTGLLKELQGGEIISLHANYIMLKGIEENKYFRILKKRSGIGTIGMILDYAHKGADFEVLYVHHCDKKHIDELLERDYIKLDHTAEAISLMEGGRMIEGMSVPSDVAYVMRWNGQRLKILVKNKLYRDGADNASKEGESPQGSPEDLPC